MWVTRKLLVPQPANAILSEEVNHSGARRFTSFENPRDMIAFLEANKCGCYYEHVEFDQPCFMYFDIDYKGNDISGEELICKFIDAFDAYFGSMYNIPPVDIGKNTQISCASREDKVSFHIVVHVKVASVQVMYILYQEFNLYCMHHDTHAVLTESIDNQVYHTSASMRCVYSHKYSNPFILIPWNGSSEKLKQHLIRYYEDVSPKPVAVITHAKGPPIDNRYINLHSKAPSIMETMSTQQLENVLDEQFYDLRKVLNVHKIDIYQVMHYENTGKMVITINHSCQPLCPYSERIHKSNHMFLVVDNRNGYVTIKCHCEPCKNAKHHKSIKSINVLKYRSEIYDGVHMTSLHCQEDCITWNEKYCEDHMHSYPREGLVCVRANMGVGKTVQLKHFLKTSVPRNAKCLMITFSQTLANKYADDMVECNFENYLNHTDKPLLTHSRLIVCLDSLYKVTMRNIDYLFIDEATSVFLHFNSSYMERSTECSTLLELLLITSKFTYLIDACIDHTFMKYIIDYVADKRKCKPYWIQNTYIRPTNRTCTLYFTVHRNHGANRARDLIDNRLQNNERVVICCSTKTFSIKIAQYIRDKYPSLKCILCNSNNTTESKNANEWNKADVLVYSPSITAGVSFEHLHFDSLIALLENSAKTPTVDISIQQLFRVRQLRSGSMEIIVVDSNKLERPALTSVEIDEFLQKDMNNINRYYTTDYGLVYSSHQTIENDQLTWDTNRLSYHILKGIIMMKNRSFEYYPLILQNTLKNDYNIPINLEVITDEGNLDEELCRIEDCGSLPSYTEEFIIDDVQYDELSYRPSKEMTSVEKAQYILHFMRKVLKVDKQYSKDLYEIFIQDGKGFDRYANIQTYISVITKTTDDLNKEYAYLISDLVHTKDKNMALYKSKQKHILKLRIILSKLVRELGIEAFKKLEIVSIHEDNLKRLIAPYINDITSNSALKSNREYNAFSWIFRKCMDASVRRAGTSTKKEKYHTILVDLVDFRRYIDKFKPKVLIDIVNT
jgi:hypothetical protein